MQAKKNCFYINASESVMARLVELSKMTKGCITFDGAIGQMDCTIVASEAAGFVDGYIVHSSAEVTTSQSMNKAGFDVFAIPTYSIRAAVTLGVLNCNDFVLNFRIVTTTRGLHIVEVEKIMKGSLNID